MWGDIRMEYDFEASIYYLTPMEGGRTSPIYSNYRGQFYYDGNNWDAGQWFKEKEVCHLGESVEVVMKLASPNFHLSKLFVG